MKDIDIQKIQLQVQASLKEIDWQKMQVDIQKVQAEINNADGIKLQKDIQNALEETRKAMTGLKMFNMEELQRQLEQAKENLKMNEGSMKEDLEKARDNINQNLKKKFRKELEKAKENVNRVAEELQDYKMMLTEMDKDGLLNANEPYDIEYKKEN